MWELTEILFLQMSVHIKELSLKIFTLLIFISLPNFSFANSETKISFKTLYADHDVCFSLRSLSTGKTIREFGKKNCEVQMSPNSTFKIPAIMMAFEKNIFKSIDQVIKWDGTVHARKEENQDLNPLTFMKHSVIWVTQWITAQLDQKTIDSFLKDFNYGNRDFSGGKDRAWLDSSLKISPYEQMSFLSRFWKNELPLSEKTVELTKKAMFISKLENDIELYGKTGSGRINVNRSRGWFVGLVKSKTDTYVFAARGLDKKDNSEPGGPRMRAIVSEKILPKLKL